MNRPVVNRNIPAGFFKGDLRIEFFTDQNITWAQCDGEKHAIESAPKYIQDIVIADMEKRPQAVWALRDAGITDEVDQLKQYTRCCFGGFDGKPDVVDGKVIHTEYWECGLRGECKYEGRLCRSIKVGDKRITLREIEFISLVCTSISDKEIADKMGIEETTLNKMKRRLGEKIGGSTKLHIMNFGMLKHIYTPYDNR